jgi:RNA polymerase sigma-70 factor (ECF subfamily)
MHTTPQTLLERLRQPGDREGWERFIKLYTPLFYYWARQAGVQDPADLIQDVFLVLIQELPMFQYDPSKSFRSWLRTILMNKVRKSLRRPPGVQLVSTDLPGPDPREDLDEAEYRQRLVARALELMQTDFQPATWKAFWECEINGRAAAEVARELGLSVGAVWVNKSRVLARLRQELAGFMD